MLPHSEVPDATGKITVQCLGDGWMEQISQKHGGSMGGMGSVWGMAYEKDGTPLLQQEFGTFEKKHSMDLGRLAVTFLHPGG